MSSCTSSWNFDSTVDRRNTCSVKHDGALRRGKPREVMPFWVADMDIPAPPSVLEALEERCRHGVFGYTEPGSDYYDALLSWFSRRFSWELNTEWILLSPGLMYAMGAAIREFTSPGDSVVIQTPVYHPFSELVVSNGRTLRNNQLLYRNGTYVMDFTGLEEILQQKSVTMLMLCSPHNPAGRVWRENELTRLGELCLRHGVLVVSDEIHSDFVLSGRHVPAASIDRELAASVITCTSATKTFNIPGLQTANIIISDSGLRSRMAARFAADGFSQLNVMGLIAGQAAYTYGESWLDSLLVYLRGNRLFLNTFLKERIPEVTLTESEATYLAWMDFSRMGISDRDLEQRLLYDCGLWLSPGPLFGPGGRGFQRLNFGCPRSRLEKGLEKLAEGLTAEGNRRQPLSQM